MRQLKYHSYLIIFDEKTIGFQNRFRILAALHGTVKRNIPMKLLQGLVAAICLQALTANAGTVVENVRIWSENERTRVVLDLDRAVDHSIFTLRGPDRIVIDLKNSRLAEALESLPAGAGSVAGIRSGLRANGQLRVVLDLSQPVRSRSFTTGPNERYGDRIVIDLLQTGTLTPVRRAADARVRGRDIVVAIDPGHGGKDPGAVGKARTREKDVVLAISKALAARIDAEPGMRAVLIRDQDIYVDHRVRMDIARQRKADLFISVHADAVDNRGPRGASVYALSLRGASDEAARQLARRENASVGGVSLQNTDDALASVLIDLSQNAALSASLEVGQAVINELARVGKVHRNTVQQAGFIVLKSPDTPSILVETGFISNPTEEKNLRSQAYQSRLADAVMNGVRNYFYQNPPPDTRIAMEMRDRPEGTVRHVIARGDTLSEIAERYNVSPTAIRRANNLNNDRIRVGQTLAIPVLTGT
jgi:N-acetylmuramoyl-L-alanine amidase